MDEQKWVGFITLMQAVLNAINEIKAQPALADPRGMAIAATHMETAMLWVANSRKES